MLDDQPTMIYRGTWDELMNHRSEIAPDAVLEVRVYEPAASPPAAKLTGGNDATIALLASWLAENATDDPEEVRQAKADLTDFKRRMNQTRREAGARLLCPDAE